MKKRILASLLSLCLLVGLLPTAALAAGEPDDECTCEALCTEEAVDDTCSVCKEGYELCTYEAPADEGEPTPCTETEGCPLYVASATPASEDETETVTDAEMSGNCGAEGNESSVIWELEQNNEDAGNPTYTLTISGSGAMADYSNYRANASADIPETATPWYKALGNHSELQIPITEVVVGEGITRLGEHAFAYTEITSLSFENNVTEYGSGLCYQCSELETVDFSGYMSNTIPKSMFDHCEKLSSCAGESADSSHELVLPAHVTEIGDYAFLNTAFEKVDFQNALKNIISVGTGAFSGMNDLETVLLSADTEYGTSTFASSGVTSLTIKDGVTEIAPSMFEQCAQLESVTFPDSLKIVGASSFAGTSLESVSLGNVQSIGQSAFANCDSLKCVSIDGTTILTIQAGTFGSAVENFELETGTLASNALLSSKSTLKTLELNGMQTIPDNMFANYTSLTDLTLGGNVEVIGESAFNGCTGLTNVTLGGKVREINDSAFYGCSSLKDITFPESLEKIGAVAFQGCVAMDSLDLGAVKEIGQNAFVNCSDLKSVKIKGSSELELQSVFGTWKNSENSYPEAAPLEFFRLDNGTIITQVGTNKSTLKTVVLGTGVTNSENGTKSFYNIASDSLIYLATDAQIKADLYSKTYTAAFFTDGGTFDWDSDFSDSGLGTPIKSGYKFEGWYTKNSEDDDLGTQIISNPQAGSTYYAKWTKSTDYSISDDDKKVSLKMTYGEQAASKTVTVSGPQESPSITKVTSSNEAIKAEASGMSVTITAADNLDVGTYTGTVYVYTGDGATLWIEVTLTVNKAGSSVTPDEGKVNIETTYGETITFVAEVVKAENSIAAITDEAEQDQVVFYCGNTLLGTAVVTYNDNTHTAGTATLEYDTSSGGIPAGSAQTVTAYYGGSINLNGSSTNSIQVTLSKIKSSVSISADPSAMTGGGEVTLTVDKSGLPEGAAVSVTCNNTAYNPTAGENGAYTVTLPDSTATYQFTVTYAGDDTHAGATADCTVSVTRSGGSSSGSGSGSTSYAITVENSRHGEVDSNRTRASSGSTVTLTVTPNEGYVLDELTVTDKNGNTVKLTDKGNGKYTFTMPRSAVTVEASFVAEADPDIPVFTDVPADAYYADAVSWAVENGITNGTSATTFGPDVSCTRAQMVTFLWRAAGSPEPTTANNPFTDVQAGSYYYDAVLWAVEQGITKGTSATTFSPDATVTRGQTVTFLWRANGSPAVSGGSFSDVAADAYYADAVAWAVSEGITNGTSSTTFSPDMNCTRAQIVTFMYRDMAD